MAIHPLTKVLKTDINKARKQARKIPDAGVKELDLRSSTAKSKARRKRIDAMLKSKGLGNPSRNKRRFVKE